MLLKNSRNIPPDLIKYQNQQLDLSLFEYKRGNFEKSKEILLTLNQEDLRVVFNHGWHLLREGKLKEGFRKLDAGRILKAYGSPVPDWVNLGKQNVPIYNNENLEDKFILFHGEGGYGDEIITIRFCKLLYDKGAKVIVGCNNNLIDLFKTLPYIHSFVDSRGSQFVHCDYWIPSMSTPGILNLNYSDISGNPYIFVQNKRNLPGNKTCKLKVGIKWAGNPEFEQDSLRTLPFNKIIDLLEIKNINFYSLQKDQRIQTGSSQEILFWDLASKLKTWTDTAEFINSLDLVITSCTAVAHLAASMGKPTWVVVPLFGYYTWAVPGNKTRWYDSVTLYRQTVYEDWTEPFERIKTDLQLVIEGKLDLLCQPLP